MTQNNFRRLAKSVLILTSIMFGLVLIPAGLMAPFSAMALDQGISIPGILLVGSFLSFPVAIVGSIAWSWIFYRQREYRFAIGISLVPLINVLVVVMLFTVLGGNE